MEIDDDSFTSKYLPAAKYIITKVQDILDSNSVASLEHVLLMIKNDLTFDDPGLFSSYIQEDPDDKLIQHAFNVYLNNRILYILSKTQYKRINRNVLDLQTEMLSGCFAKQPWLFEELTLQYIEVNNQLVDNNFTIPFNITLFQLANFDYTIFGNTCSIESIKIDSYDIRDHIVDNNVALLTRILSIQINNNDKIIEQSNECLLKTFSSQNLKLKVKCMKYFTKLLKYTKDSCASFLIKTIPRLIQMILFIYKQMDGWFQHKSIQPDDITQFNYAIVNLLEQDVLLQFCREQSSFNKIMIEICMEILRIIQLKVNQYDRNLIIALLMFTKRLTDDKVLQIEKMIMNTNAILTAESIPLLQNIFLNRLKQGEMDCSVEWNVLMDKALFNVTPIISQDQFNDHMLFIQAVFDLIKNIKHEFTFWHQTNHINNNLETCPICAVAAAGSEIKIINILDINLKYKKVHLICFPNLQVIVQSFLTELNMTIYINPQNLLKISAIAWSMLVSPSCHQLSSYQQEQLLQIANCLFFHSTCSLFKNFYEQYPAIEAAIKNQQQTNGGNLETFHASIVDVILQLNLNDLSKPMQTKFISLLNEIDVKIMCKTFVYKILLHCLAQDVYRIEEFIDKIAKLNLQEPNLHKPVTNLLRSLICTAAGSTVLLQIRNTDDDNIHYKIVCSICEKNENVRRGVIHLNHFSNKNNLELIKFIEENLANFFSSNETVVRANMATCLPALANHCPGMLASSQNQIAWTAFFGDKSFDVQHRLGMIIPTVITGIEESTLSMKVKQNIMQKCLNNMLGCIIDSVEDKNQQYQSSVLNILYKFGTIKCISEKTLLRCFCMTFYYLIKVESVVSKEAGLCAIRMCAAHNLTPTDLVNWYKDFVFKLICRLGVFVFLEYDYGLVASLTNFYTMLGFTPYQQKFVIKYFENFIVNLLPWCIEFPKCEALYNELCSALNREMGDMLTKSFIQIYPHLLLHEDSNVRAKCVEFIENHTEISIYQHLRGDIQKTLTTILMYYHRNPEFVMNTFRIFLNETESSDATTDFSMDYIATYISKHFLGVLTTFGQVLSCNDIERKQQREILLSLGDIIRFMGSRHITPFRFKILAMLCSALTTEQEEQKNICAQIWKIFIFTVDIQLMGPLLSIIFVSLEPLQTSHSDIVNEILKYLIISNGSLLSLHISDLFFLEETKTSDEIKQFVQKHSNGLSTSSSVDNKNFLDKVNFFINQINHENLHVRIYGLKYTTKLFVQCRFALNNLIMGQQKIHPAVESLLNSLMLGTRQVEKNLQLASGICLGKMGAIEPSLLPPNYAPEKQFALSIRSDAFSIMALAELCRAYQFQKDKKYVDGFSLAIQEILLARGVCPETGKKLNVWNAIPERLRQLMEPLLKSFYTVMGQYQSKSGQIIFNSVKCGSSESWGYKWASSMIEAVNDQEIKHLLRSFKPSMKNDAEILAMFLPYVIVHTLGSCNDNYNNQMINELNAVFTYLINEPSPDDTVECFHTDYTMNCAKLAFNQLDFLDRWLRKYQIEFNNVNDPHFIKISTFLQNFDKKFLARANFKCGEYARALMHTERYIAEDPKTRLQSELSFIAQIYAELMDSDSLEGAIRLKNTKPTLAEEIMLNSATGRLQDSAVCFEKLMQINEITEHNVTDMMQCYIGLDQPETALLLAKSLMKQLYDDKIYPKLLTESAEPLWRLGRFEELDELLENDKLRDSEHWGIRCGQVLLSFRKGCVDEFNKEIEKCRLSVLKQLSATGDSQTSYNKVYSLVMKLHLITEMEDAQNVVNKFATIETKNEAHDCLIEFVREWTSRLEILQPTARIVDPVLCLRRTLLNEANALIKKNCRNSEASRYADQIINNYIGKSLIKSTELARNAEMYQKAQLFILNAESYGPKNLFIEKARLFWKKGDQSNSLKILKRGIEENEKIGKENSRENRQIIGEAKFLIANYNAESMNTNTNLNIQYFKSAISALPDSEKCLVYYAQYLEKVYAAMTPLEQAQQKGGEMQLEIVSSYGKSMMFGCNYVHQSMPRFLSIWLDFTAISKPDANHAKVALGMNQLAERFSETLPPIIFFTAFSQLVSRICHPSNEVYNILKKIIIKLILFFPQQSLWMILSVYKSSYTSRVRRCRDIFEDKRLSPTDIQKLITDFNSLAEGLIELTNKEMPRTNEIKPQSKFSMNSVFRSLPQLLSNRSLSNIILPNEKHMQPVLPLMGQREKPITSFNAFPNNAVYIHGVRDEIMVLASLQRPKRITLVGSDGNEYMIMMKPKDDLRKDFRLMEFNAVVKEHLHQDPDARQRRLNIRTYAVLPLNEECGIIEWVPNLNTFRHIVTGYYEKGRKLISNKELKHHFQSAKDFTAKKKLLVNILIPKHPPVFAEWFRESFTTPHNWYQARSSYIRTTAVMSIVGYILGLGDRHGENILFDAENGDTVHVDFNCLFNKGEQFDVPELVPFRLTHNMVHAMGPLGIEGLFRKCSEITLKVMQEQMATLMSVLRPFVYDPLVSWNRPLKTDGKAERIDSQAMANIKRIEERLKGFVKINGLISNMPLSTEGVVNHCIEEATDIDKLALMYVGWGSYL